MHFFEFARFFVVVALLVSVMTVQDGRTAQAAPANFARVDELVREAVEKNRVPGAVVLIGHRGRVALQRAYGYAGARPQTRAMTLETIFDLASLTKPVATSTAAMLLVEEGKIELDAPISKYLPVFDDGDKAKITVRHLLTHTAGFVAGGAYWGKTRTNEQMLDDIVASNLRSLPGEKFLYSDFSFVTLGAVIEAASGQPLDQFCRERIFMPLGLNDTFFRRNETALTPQVLSRVAATTADDDTTETRGLVHDPTARAMGGVAGHAGLFSTANDLARFSRMVLNGGELDGKRVLKPETVRMWLALQTPGLPGERTLGWDMASPYSVRGALSPASFGHTGFTGTSLWIDPASQTFIILLTNSVHAKPSASPIVIPLRRAVSNAVAAAVAPASPVVANNGVRTGLEILVAEDFKRLEGKKIGVVCNHTAVDKQFRHLVDLMVEKKLNIVALFGPEHGIRGDVDEGISGSSIDAKTGLKVYSLYDYKVPKETRFRPTSEMLEGIDTLVFDIQDIGSRYYTYITTLGYVMEEAAKHKIKVIVLDRPNPIGGNLIEGPDLDVKFASLAAYHNMPISHGLTIGELALLFNAERKIGADLEVVKMTGWTRDMLFDQTGLPWLNPSPNMRSVRQAWLYAGVGFLEVLPISVGRGTDTPFELIGAPWLDATTVAADLNARKLPGVSFVPTRFTPTTREFKGVLCQGIQIFLWDRAACRPAELGVQIADAMVRRHPDRLTAKVLSATRGMIGNENAATMLVRGDSPSAIIASWRGDVEAWKKRRAPFLLYR